MKTVSFNSILFMASLIVGSQCRIISTQDKENNKYLEDIDKMIEEIHYEEAMREIDVEHSIIIDDMHLDEAKHLEKALNYESNMLEENFQLPNI